MHAAEGFLNPDVWSCLWFHVCELCWGSDPSGLQLCRDAGIKPWPVPHAGHEALVLVRCYRCSRNPSVCLWRRSIDLYTTVQKEEAALLPASRFSDPEGGAEHKRRERWWKQMWGKNKTEKEIHWIFFIFWKIQIIEKLCCWSVETE